MRDSICTALKSAFRKTEESQFMIRLKRTHYVLGENVYQHGTIRFKLKLESFQNNHWILVGIVKADVVPKDPYSYNWAGAYGWSLGNGGQF